MLFVFLHFRFLWKMSVLETISFLNCFLVYFYSRMSQIRSAPSSLLLVKKKRAWGTQLWHPYSETSPFNVRTFLNFLYFLDCLNFLICCAFWLFKLLGFWILIFLCFLNFLNFLGFLKFSEFSVLSDFQCFLNIRGFLYFLHCFFNLN